MGFALLLWLLVVGVSMACGTIIPLLITLIPLLILVSVWVLLNLLVVLLRLLAATLLMIGRVTAWLGTRRDGAPSRCVQLECTRDGLLVDGTSAHAWTDFSTIGLSDDGVLLCLRGTGSDVPSPPQVIWMPFGGLVQGSPEQTRTWFRDSGLLSEGQDKRFWHIRGAGGGSVTAGVQGHP